MRNESAVFFFNGAKIERTSEVVVLRITMDN